MSKSSRATIDHEEIRRWVEERGGSPATVKGTGGRDEAGILRIDFPGFSGVDTLEPISWDEFFAKFDEKELALIIQDRLEDGTPSRFNKLVSRHTVDLKTEGRGREHGRGTKKKVE
jgi:hypothetical protein